MQSRFDSISFYLIFRGNWCRGRYLSLPYFRAFRLFAIALLHRITLQSYSTTLVDALATTLDFNYLRYFTIPVLFFGMCLLKFLV